MAQFQQGDVVWRPSPALLELSTMARYRDWVAAKHGVDVSEYSQLWDWSVSDLPAFWQSIWEFFGVRHSVTYRAVLEGDQMPGHHWFDGARLNYAQNLLEGGLPEAVALISCSESEPVRTLSYAELRSVTASVAASLRRMGVGPGDRVAAYLPNVPAAVIGFLATASLGAIWSACSPEFGSDGVVSRFQQIEPKVLITCDGYTYNGRTFDRTDVVRSLMESLPTLEQVIIVSSSSPPARSRSRLTARLKDGPRLHSWDELQTEAAELRFEQLPFEHPLWILYSSGTTGVPKGIVHSHGGVLLEYLKCIRLHLNVIAEDRVFWYTTTGWVMWNFMLGSLLSGAAVVIYDGSPGYPDLTQLWRLAEDARVSFFGTSPAYLQSCITDGIEPARRFDLHSVRTINCTGAPLPVAVYQWVHDQFGPKLWLISTSGGTDTASAFVGACPLLPVRAGELQCRYLGAGVEAFNESGKPVIGDLGELVITTPLPSMPLRLWNDPDGTIYRETYFTRFLGVWTHGDSIRVNPDGSVVVYGRSDSTLNRKGVRIGTSEIYSVVEMLPEVCDSLVVGLQWPDGEYWMPLFVELSKGYVLTSELRARISAELRARLSPRHVPDEVIAVARVPRNRNAKKLEVPVKRILMGGRAGDVVSLDSLEDPSSLFFYEQLARDMALRRARKA